MEGDLVSFSPGAVREELQSTVGDRRLDGDWMETGTGTGDRRLDWDWGSRTCGSGVDM
jgi:hypothetical protein